MNCKIFFLANAANIHTQRWAVHLSKEYSITVLSFEKAQIDGVEIILLQSPINGLLRYLWVLPFVLKILRKYKPNILHAHYAGGYGLLGLLTSFHPYVLSVWGSDVYQAPRNSLVSRWVLKLMLMRADFVCSTSVAMAKEAKKYANRDFLITPFGVDCDTYKPLDLIKPKEKFIIGTVKKLDKLYGVDLLLRSFAILCEQSPNISLHLLIVGDGEEKSNLVMLAHELEIASHVEFYGSAVQDDVPALLNRMNVFVALSRSESFGVAVLEASACGIPVVVSDVGGLPEVVIDDETGFVITDGDPNLAATAIKKLMDSAVLREKMGGAGQQFVKSKYQWIDTAKNIESLYENLKADFLK